MSIGTTANSVFRDHVTLGVPASGLHEPVKSEIRSLFTDIDNRLTTQRQVFTASRELWVNPAGNDANPGTSVSPLRTLQKAWDIAVQNYDLAGYLLTVRCQDGTYTAGVKDTSKPISAGRVQFTGNPTTPGNCIINSTAANEDCFLFDNSEVGVSGFRMISAGSAMHTARNGTILTGPGLEFGACTEYHFFADNLGKFVVNDNYTILGGADGHFYAHSGAWIGCTGRTITIQNTPAFTTGFAIGVQGGILEAHQNTFVNAGAVTGRKFYCNWGGIIYPGDPAGLNYFPGSLAGENIAGFYGSLLPSPTTTGSFTPRYEGFTTAGTTTHSAQSATWERVGNLISFQARAQWTAQTGGAGGACIAGLPAPAAGDWTFPVWFDAVTVGSGKMLTGFLGSGTDKVRLFASDPAGGSFATVATEAAGDIIISGTYRAA